MSMALDTAEAVAGVLGCWGEADRSPRLVAARENEVFAVCLASGGRAALRLHRPGYRSAEAISAEMALTSALAADGFPCPAPIPTIDGAWIAHAPDGRLASMVSWVEAEPLSALGPTADHMRHLGILIGRFHGLTDALAPDLQAMPGWTAETLLGDAPLWGPFWENPTLTAEEAALLRQARAAARAELAAMEAPDIGPIHGDLLPDNVLADPARLWLIDFDDCGVGYRGYDLGTALVSYAEAPDYPERAAALLAGYASGRGQSAPGAAELRLFVLLRALASCGWAVGRVAEDDPRRTAYAQRAVRLAERWLSRRGA